MAFGYASLPIRKYVYGAREFLPGPREKVKDEKQPRLRFEGHSLAVDQLRRANEFQNKLVELEQARRENSSRIIHEAFPDLAALLTAAETLDAEVTELRAQINAVKSQERTRKANPELAAAARERASARSQAWAAYRTRRTEAYRDEAVKTALANNETTHTANVTAARADAIKKGLYWATAGDVISRVSKSGPPPRFKGFRGEGLLAVQFQRKPDKTSERVAVLNDDGTPRIHPRSGKPTMRNVGGSSLLTDDIHSENTLCWIQKTEHKRHVIIHFRVGSTTKGEPIWARLPANMHRPLPAKSEIKWAFLSCRKIGNHSKWEVHFDIAMKEERWEILDAQKPRPQANSGTLAVALGWRKIGDEIRVAVWRGDDDREGEVTIPAAQVDRWKFCDVLQAMRDKEFERCRALLLTFLHGKELSEEWQRRTNCLHQWRSSGRFAALIWWWRNNRLKDDEKIFDAMEGITGRELTPVNAADRPIYGVEQEQMIARCANLAGRRLLYRLRDLEDTLRARCRNWRKHFYRHRAIELMASYKDAVVAEIDWHAIAENLPPEESDENVNKTYRGIAACASLRDEFLAYLCEREVSAVGITVTCATCGGNCPNPGAGRWIVCESCGGARIDRAVNATKNLLRRGLVAIPTE